MLVQARSAGSEIRSATPNDRQGCLNLVLPPAYPPSRLGIKGQAKLVKTQTCAVSTFGRTWRALQTGLRDLDCCRLVFLFACRDCLFKGGPEHQNADTTSTFCFRFCIFGINAWFGIQNLGTPQVWTFLQKTRRQMEQESIYMGCADSEVCLAVCFLSAL